MQPTHFFDAVFQITRRKNHVLIPREGNRWPSKKMKELSTYVLLVHVGVFIGTEIDVKVLGFSFPDTQKKIPRNKILKGEQWQ